MKFHRFILPALLFFISHSFLFSQTKFDFDLQADWQWEDLIDKTISDSPPNAPLVQNLRERLTLEDARLLFKELNRLNSLKGLQNLNEVTLTDTETNRKIWYKIFSDSLSNVLFEDSFSGLLKAAVKISSLRKLQKNSVSEFKNISYLPQPEEESISNAMVLNYQPAEDILSLLSEEKINSGGLSETLNSEAYRILFNSIENDLTERVVRNFIEESDDRTALNNIYKWINTASFMNFGGVFLYKENYKNVLEVLKDNEQNLKKSVLKRVFQFIPDISNLNVQVNFVFGNSYPAQIVNNNKIFISLEYFTDDYSSLLEMLIHEVFRIAHKDIQISIYELVFDKNDLKFVSLLNEAYKTGIANYAGPVGTETRPSALLEKDFELFSETFEYIYGDRDKAKTDTIIKRGFSGIGPFYTMVTQMAYIIENILGKKALNESTKLGPFNFFANFINAYKVAPEKIRDVFRFKSDIENKISELNKKIPDDLLNYSIGLDLSNPDSLKKNIEKLMQNRNYLPELLYAVTGEIFLKAGMIAESKSYFIKLAEKNPAGGNTYYLIGRKFLTEGFFDETADFAGMIGAESGKKYYLLAAANFKKGNLTDSDRFVSKAISLNKDFTEAGILMLKIQNEK